jgi:diacylglycerol kinase (ATP)
MEKPAEINEGTRTPRQNVLVVYNPIAGSRSSLLERTLKSLESLGVQIVLRETRGPGDGETLCREAIGQKSYSAVVAAGGDGTINEVANGLLGTETPLGIIPLGTVNLLAMEMGLQKDPGQVARCIAFAPARPINVGLVNERAFLLMVGAGFDGRVVAGVSSSLKKVIGKGAYVVAGLAEISFNFPARLTVEVDGAKYEAAWAVVSNSSYYAGKFALAPAGNLQSPGFTVSLIPGKTQSGLISGLVAVWRDRKAKRGWTQLNSVNRVTIKSDQNDPAQMDGDYFAPLPLTLTQAPQSLNLIMPPLRGEETEAPFA